MDLLLKRKETRTNPKIIMKIVHLKKLTQLKSNKSYDYEVETKYLKKN